MIIMGIGDGIRDVGQTWVISERDGRVDGGLEGIQQTAGECCIGY